MFLVATPEKPNVASTREHPETSKIQAVDKFGQSLPRINRVLSIFFANYAEVAATLTDLTKKDAPRYDGQTVANKRSGHSRVNFAQSRY